MNVIRRIGTIVAVTVTAVGMLAAPAAAASPSGPHTVTILRPTVPADTPTWVTVWWRTDQRICDARVVMSHNPRVTVTYPSGRSYTSFAKDSTLDRGERDYTAIKVTAHYPRGSWALLRGRIHYNDCGPLAQPLLKDVRFLLLVRR